MTLNIGQLLDDAKRIRKTIADLHDGDYDAFDELKAIDRIIAYFEERYVPPSEPGSFRQARGIIESDEPAEVSIRRIRGGDRPAPPEPTPAEYPPGYTQK